MTEIKGQSATSKSSPGLTSPVFGRKDWRCPSARTAAAIFTWVAIACAADPVSAQEAPSHPLAGKWTWSVPGKKCAETLSYRLDGTRAGTSGEEVSEARFQVTPVPSLLGFYRLTETLTRANGKRDCSGDLNAVGAESTVRFIQFNPQKDFLIVCKAEALTACYGPLQQVPQAP